MRKNYLVAPVVKWVGGKRQLLGAIRPLLPKKIKFYCEPFLGGAALLFAIQPQKAIVNDINPELISLYQVIRDNVGGLIKSLKKHINTPEYFYQIRDWDRRPETYCNIPPVEKASRIIFLNKTCYNGLFRVNSAGQFNSPYGYYKNPNIINEPVLLAVSKYLNSAAITFTSIDYSTVLNSLPKGAFAYLDPPYDPISYTSSFTSYTKSKFDRNEQMRLKEFCDELDKKQINFLLSNSATDFIINLYKDYDITIVNARRAVNSDSEKRGGVAEVLIKNYDCEQQSMGSLI